VAAVSQPDVLRIGISSCLLGENVRFDGGHKRDGFITGTLSQFVEFVPVCPELEVGLGVPRESLRLVRPRPKGEVRIVAPKSGADHTDAMREFSARRVAQLAALDLDGYLLKKDSPSCGFQRVKVYDHNNAPARTGTGMFTEALVGALPRLPVEDEGRLNDPVLRENFFVRVFGYRRLKRLFREGWKLGDLVEFHTREKLLLRAHHEGSYRELGRLVAGAKGMDRARLRGAYEAQFMDALAHRATIRRNVNVLQHAAGHFKKLVGPKERAELAGLIEDYRNQLVPLVVPLTLMRHFVRMHDVEYLAGQTYLEPHPKELMLRNHV